MGIVLKIRGKKAAPGAEKLLKDVRVNDGSLLLHDFANGGSFVNEDIKDGSQLFDLSDDISRAMGIDNSTRLVTDVDKKDSVIFTEGKGIDFQSITSGASTSNPRGFNLGMGIVNYLKANNPRFLAIFLIRVKSEGNNSGRIVTTNSPASAPIINFQATSAVSCRMAGATSGAMSLVTDQFMQYAFEFQGVGLPIIRYVNGAYQGTGPENATGFDTIETAIPLVIGARDVNVASIYYYGTNFYDLDKAGKSAEQLVREDYEYITGTGIFEGKGTRRPYVDTI